MVVEIVLVLVTLVEIFEVLVVRVLIVDFKKISRRYSGRNSKRFCFSFSSGN